MTDTPNPKEDQKDQKSVNEEKNLSIPSGQPLKDNSSDAAPSFTPGPWLLTQGKGGEWGVDSQVGDWGIAIVAGQCGANGIDGDGESDANARLIAAAPALYAALKEILNYGVELDDERMDYVVAQVDRESIKDARAALALANGQVTSNALHRKDR